MYRSMYCVRANVQSNFHNASFELTYTQRYSCNGYVLYKGTRIGGIKTTRETRCQLIDRLTFLNPLPSS